jgi:hypothetical protein
MKKAKVAVARKIAVILHSAIKGPNDTEIRWPVRDDIREVLSGKRLEFGLANSPGT